MPIWLKVMSCGGVLYHAITQNIFEIRLPASALQAILELQVAKLHTFARLEFRTLFDYSFIETQPI